MEHTLLEELSAHLGKNCLSDLHRVPVRDLLEAIRRIDANQYSLEQWSYALSYIRGKEIKITDREGIARELR